MNTKKGYVSVEAVVLAALVTIAGFVVFSETKEAVELAAVRALGLDIRLTQELDNVVNNPYAYETDEPSSWTSDENSALKDTVANGQVVLRNIEINIVRNQSKWVGETLQVIATIDGVLSVDNVVYWTVISGSENVILTPSGLGNSTVDIYLLKQGTTIVRATDQNKTTFKDIVITIQ